MNSKTIHKQIMRDYEAARSTARRNLEERKARVYNDIPRAREIEEELMMLGVKLSRFAFSAEENTADLVSELRETAKTLNGERAALIKAGGYADDFLSEQWQCGICKDTGYVEDEKCVCYRQKLISKYYEISSLKDILQKENFDTFNLDLYSKQKDERLGISPHTNMRQIYSDCAGFVKNFTKHGANLLFSGDSGLGKTFMCNCIAKEAMDSGHPVLYVTAPAMFKALEAYRFSDDKTTEMAERINMLTDVDLLIIDDLGSEFYTVITGTELFNIVNSRMLARKSTVISTNLSETDLQRIYSDRLVSRFLGNYKIYYFFGDDIRIEKRLME